MSKLPVNCHSFDYSDKNDASQSRSVVKTEWSSFKDDDNAETCFGASNEPCIDSRSEEFKNIDQDIVDKIKSNALNCDYYSLTFSRNAGSYLGLSSKDISDIDKNYNKSIQLLDINDPFQLEAEISKMNLHCTEKASANTKSLWQKTKYFVSHVSSKIYHVVSHPGSYITAFASISYLTASAAGAGYSVIGSEVVKNAANLNLISSQYLASTNQTLSDIKDINTFTFSSMNCGSVSERASGIQATAALWFGDSVSVFFGVVMHKTLEKTLQDFCFQMIHYLYFLNQNTRKAEHHLVLALINSVQYSELNLFKYNVLRKCKEFKNNTISQEDRSKLINALILGSHPLYDNAIYRKTAALFIILLNFGWTSYDIAPQGLLKHIIAYLSSSYYVTMEFVQNGGLYTITGEYKISLYIIQILNLYLSNKKKELKKTTSTLQCRRLFGMLLYKYNNTQDKDITDVFNLNRKFKLSNRLMKFILSRIVHESKIDKDKMFENSLFYAISQISDYSCHKTDYLTKFALSSKKHIGFAIFDLLSWQGWSLYHGFNNFNLMCSNPSEYSSRCYNVLEFCTYNPVAGTILAYFYPTTYPMLSKVILWIRPVVIRTTFGLIGIASEVRIYKSLEMRSMDDAGIILAGFRTVHAISSASLFLGIVLGTHATPLEQHIGAAALCVIDSLMYNIQRIVISLSSNETYFISNKLKLLSCASKKQDNEKFKDELLLSKVVENV